MIVYALWWTLFSFWVVSEVFIALLRRTKHGSGNVQDRGTQKILWVVILVAVTACNWVSEVQAHNMFGGANWLKLASIAVLIIALCIRWAAIISLGKSFSANVAIRASQTIYNRGLYRWVRHPSYLGLLLVFFAVGLHSRNWIGLVIAMVPTTAAVLYRIHVEEAALTQAFGDAYVTYSKETSRLLPGLY